MEASFQEVYPVAEIKPSSRSRFFFLKEWVSKEWILKLKSALFPSQENLPPQGEISLNEPSTFQKSRVLPKEWLEKPL